VKSFKHLPDFNTGLLKGHKQQQILIHYFYHCTVPSVIYLITHTNTCTHTHTHIYIYIYIYIYILRIIQRHTHMVSMGSNPILNHSNSIHMICITMRTNIILRCNCNYKPSICNPVRRKGSSSMSMRGVRGICIYNSSFNPDSLIICV